MSNSFAATTAAPPHGSAGSFDYTKDDFLLISNLLREETGIHLQDSKSTLVYSRIAKRVRALGLSSFGAYCEHISRDTAERQIMIEALTTNTTNFFRENHHFEYLQKELVGTLVEAARRRRPVRIWSSASSSGQEPYSIALTILAVAPDAPKLDIRILATDVNTQMVARGAAGTYDEEEVREIPAAQLSRYFTKSTSDSGPRYTATDEIKKLISFQQLNLFENWPMRRRFDVIFCRNVMIYFSAETQMGLWQRLAEKLDDGGCLFIGHSERVTGACAAHLEPIGITAYRKRVGQRS